MHVNTRGAVGQTTSGGRLLVRRQEPVDMALGTWTSIYLVAFAMMVAGKTAVKVGAWHGPRRRSPRPLVEQVPPRRLW